DLERAAIREDVQAIFISSYKGGRVEFFSEVVGLLKKQGAGDIGVFGGGGGTITLADANLMKRRGVDEIFFPGTPFSAIVDFVQRTYEKPGKGFKPRMNTDEHGWEDRWIAKLLSVG